MDMRDLTKANVSGSNRTNDDDSGDDNNADEPMPARAAKRSGGVLKGGGDYVSSGEQRPRPRVSFLLDSAPGQGQGGGSVQIRVYAKPPQVQLARRYSLPDVSTSYNMALLWELSTGSYMG